MTAAAQTDNPVILIGAAGGVKDLRQQTETVILNQQSCHPERSEGSETTNGDSHPEPTVLSS